MINCRMCDKPLMYDQKYEEWVHTADKEWHCEGKISVATPDNLCASRYYGWDGEPGGSCDLEEDHAGPHSDDGFEWSDDDVVL